MTEHRAQSMRAQTAAAAVLVVSLGASIFVVAATVDDAEPPQVAAARVEPTTPPAPACDEVTAAEIGAAVRAELDRATVDIEGKRAKWSQASVLAALMKRADQ